MTKEEKQILLVDLCARFPYGLLIDTPRGTFELDAIAGDLISLKDKEGRLSDLLQDTDGKYWFPIVTGNYKPYLRPMSSMSEEEKNELCKILGCDDINKKYEYITWIFNDMKQEEVFGFDVNIQVLDNTINWLNKKMLDLRGLIPKGLALEAKEGMYNIK